MQFTTAAITALVAVGAIASPVIKARDDSGKPKTSQCGVISKDGEPTNQWGVWEINSLMPSAQGTSDYAGGFLDNLRGKCGKIHNWQAVPDGHGGIVSIFNTDKKCQGYEVAAALNLAESADHPELNEWVICSGDTWNGLLDQEEKVSEETMSYMSDILSVAGAFIPKGGEEESGTTKSS